MWRELRGVVGQAGRGRVEVQQRPAVLSFDELQELEALESYEEVPATSLAVEPLRTRLSWWEVEHWDEIVDDHTLWGDLSPEGMRILKELLEAKRMDT